MHDLIWSRLTPVNGQPTAVLTYGDRVLANLVPSKGEGATITLADGGEVWELSTADKEKWTITSTGNSSREVATFVPLDKDTVQRAKKLVAMVGETSYGFDNEAKKNWVVDRAETEEKIGQFTGEDHAVRAPIVEMEVDLPDDAVPVRDLVALAVLSRAALEGRMLSFAMILTWSLAILAVITVVCFLYV